MITIEEALKEIYAHKLNLPVENVPLASAYGRYLARAVPADRDIPPFHRATVDGFAVRSGDMNVFASQGFQVAGKHFAGDAPVKTPPSGMALHTMTGACVPEGLDLLFKIEDCRLIEKESRTLVFPPASEKGHAPGLNIEARGTNKKTGETLIEAGAMIGADNIHALAAAGKTEIEVFARPDVAVVSTGTELVDINETPEPWQIRDTNRAGISLMLASSSFALTPSYSAASPDDPDTLRKTLQEGLKRDILIISGGVSMGDSDFVPAILQELGVKEIFHKVKIKPGKPLWFGARDKNHSENKTGRDTVVFALPGNPLATMLSMKLFIEPFIMLSMGAASLPGALYLPLSAPRKLKGDRPHYIPARLVHAAGVTQVEILPSGGSGDIASTVGSDGMALHPSETRELNKGDIVAFYPWRGL